MQWFSDIAVGVLSLFLAFSNGLAGFISPFFADTPATPSEHSETVSTGVLNRIPSSFEGGFPIPDILLKNADYQQAALISGFDKPGATAADPKDALVNIFCTFRASDYIRTTTGTGFFVHPDGVVMTNAHVAQFLLLETTTAAGETECILRTGSPATPRFEAELLYIPPAWVSAHANLIDAVAPQGTGERDYALLYVTAGLDNQPMPQVFPSLQMDTALLPLGVIGNTVFAAGYPAQAFIENGSDAALVPKLASTSISELYTFGSNYADVFSIRGSEIGEQGASGGPIITPDGRVIGMISTRGDDATDGPGSLRAITISHIDRTIREETGYELQANLTGNLPYRAKLFNDSLTPFLALILSREIRE